MGFLIEWLIQQRSILAISGAVALFVITLILRYGFGLWWPWGIMMAVFLGVAGMVSGMRE